VALEQLLQSQGWALLANSLKTMIRADRKMVVRSAGTLDELVHLNRIAARAEVLLTLVDLPNNMLEDIKEDLLEIYENEEFKNE
jgi:hypothetical protein